MTMRNTALLFVALGSSACVNSLSFATSTQIGIDLNATENAQQHAIIGYKRSETVVMPVQEEKDGPVRENAYSVIAASNFESGPLLLAALTSTKVKTVFATGKAAIAGGTDAVAAPFHATYAEIFSPEESFLNLELRNVVATVSDRERDNVHQAIWQAIDGTDQIGPRRLLLYGVQAAGNDALLQSGLSAGRSAAGMPAALSEDDQRNVVRALVDFINQADGQPHEGATYDAIASQLEGADAVSNLTDDELLRELIDLATLQSRVDELRNALSAALVAASS